MISLDTNYLLRFLTNDIKSQSMVAKRLIKSAREIYIPVVAFAEAVYFLRNYYKRTKKQVCSELSLLIKQSNIKAENFVAPAIQIYKSEAISFYDSLIIAQSLITGCEVRTFDKKFSKVFNKYLQD